MEPATVEPATVEPTTVDPATVELNDLPESSRRLGGIGRTTLYVMIRNGEIGTVRIGNRVFIPSDEIARFIDRHRHHATGDDDAA